MQAQEFSDPKMIVNLNNIISYEIKKDLRIDIVEKKPGIFSTQAKYSFKALNIDDLEAWVNLI